MQDRIQGTLEDGRASSISCRTRRIGYRVKRISCRMGRISYWKGRKIGERAE
jgi:hypothetical protein